MSSMATAVSVPLKGDSATWGKAAWPRHGLSRVAMRRVLSERICEQYHCAGNATVEKCDE
jgi:hypothetical protein